MNLQEFIKKYEGKVVDNDGAYGGQCMDLMHFYVREVLELDSKQLSAPGAYQSYVKGGPDFDKISYVLGTAPKAGDLVYWDHAQYGHVDICIEDGDENGFIGFDQNWPVGAPCSKVNHNYRNVVGWLRSKHHQPTPPNQLQKKRMKIIEKQRLVWNKRTTQDKTATEFWVIKQHDEHPKETRHRLKDAIPSTVAIFAFNEAFSRVTTEYIDGLVERDGYNTKATIISHPDLFEVV